MYRNVQDKNMHVFLPMNHRHEKKAQSEDHSCSNISSFFPPQIQRPSGSCLRNYELKDFEHVMYSESDDEIKGPILTQEEAAGSQQALIQQDMHTSVLSRLSTDEETCQLYDHCELSLSFNPMIPQYQKQSELTSPSTDEHGSPRSTSTGNFSNIKDFQEVGSNHINLDLTISTTIYS